MGPVLVDALNDALGADRVRAGALRGDRPAAPLSGADRAPRAAPRPRRSRSGARAPAGRALICRILQDFCNTSAAGFVTPLCYPYGNLLHPPRRVSA